MNVTKKLTVQSEYKGAEQTSAAAEKVRQSYERIAQAMERYAQQMQQYERMERQNAQFRQASIDSTNRLAAANDNLAKSLSAATDNSRAAGEGFRISGLDAASLTNHLKQAAVVLYSTSSAFRGLVHASVVPALRGVSAAVTATGAAVNIAGAGLITGGAAIAALGPRFAPIAAGITSAGQAMAAFSPTVASLAVQASGLFSFLARVAAVVFVVTTAIKLLVTSVTDGIRDFTAFQDKQVELANVLKATGGASGKTSEDINKLAESMGDIGNSRAAARTLLEFQTISGTTFDRSLKAAHDLSATGFGDVTSAAQAMGKALTSPESGLDGLAKAGVRFTTQQKELIKNLVETGRSSEAYSKVLDIVEGKVGGSAAAAANTLSGAYRSLADATLIGSEQFGAQIVSVTKLQAVIQTLAAAMNALNNFKLSDNARTGIDMIMRGVFRIKGKLAVPERNDPIDREQVQSGAGIAAMQMQRDKIDAVTIALNKELEALRQSEVQKQIDVNLRKAGVASTSDAGRAIAATTTQIHNEKEAIKAAEEARRQDEATAKRQAEQLRRMDEDRNNRTTQLMVERAAIGLTAEAALALRLREEELGKVRRFGIAETPELVASIDAWAKGYAKLSIENEKFRDGLRQTTELTSNFTQTLVQGLLDGKNGMDALIAAAGQLGNSMSQIGTKNFSEGMVGAFKGKGLTGFDPQSLAIGGIGMLISLWSGAEQKRKAEAEAQARAQEEWHRTALQFQGYLAKSYGGSVGSIQGQLQDHRTEAERLIKLRSESQGFKSAAQENADPIIRQIRDAFGNYSKRLVDAFATTFPALLEGLQSGFGPDSPLFRAFEDTKTLGENLQSKIADAEFVFGKNSGQVNQLRGASQQFALSTLQRQTPLSEVETELQQLYGRAKGLQTVLEGLGMSSIDAAKAIEEGVGKAINSLRTSFTEDLQNQINDLSGKGFLNSFDDLFKKAAEQQRINAALGGGSTELINKLFVLNAQKIVDESKLTGEAFQELIARFPELSGVVKEFSELVEQVAKRSADDIAKARLSIEDQIFALTNDNTTLEGQLAELRRGQERELLDEERIGNENRLILLQKHQLEEAKLIRDANQRKLDEEKRAADERARAINQAARGVLETIQGWQAGPSSTLSPQDILTNAQVFYNSNLALAQGSPSDQVTIDAVNKWSQLAENVERALRSVYGSATQYQTGKSQLIAEGLALPTVQAADDPLVVALRNAVTAINLLNGVTGGVNTGFNNLIISLAGLISPTGSLTTFGDRLAAFATDLVGVFDQIDTDLSGGLTAAELQTALGMDFSTGTLKSIFTELDNNGNGIIEKSEAVRLATEGTRGNVGENNSAGARGMIAAVQQSVIDWGNNTAIKIEPIAGAISSVGSGVVTSAGSIVQKVVEWGSSNAAAIDAVSRAVASVQAAVGDGTGSGSLQALNATAKDQLTLLNNQLTAGAVAPPPGIGGGVGVGGGLVGPGATHNIDPNFGGGSNNNTIRALNKIVYNTAAIAHNTLHFIGASPTRWTGGVNGILAAGGWIGGSLHSQGGTNINAERGEHVTNRISAGYNRSLLDAINAARGPIDMASFLPMNDNFSTRNIVPLPVSAGRSDAGFNFARMLSVMEAQSKEIAELKKEVAAFRKENAHNTVASGNLVASRVDKNTEAVSSDSKEQAFQQQQNRRQSSRR